MSCVTEHRRSRRTHRTSGRERHGVTFRLRSLGLQRQHHLTESFLGFALVGRQSPFVTVAGLSLAIQPMLGCIAISPRSGITPTTTQFREESEMARPTIFGSLANADFQMPKLSTTTRLLPWKVSSWTNVRLRERRIGCR